jgi:coenzyme F420-reducing hydrogenase gamma subunit
VRVPWRREAAGGARCKGVRRACGVRVMEVRARLWGVVCGSACARTRGGRHRESRVSVRDVVLGVVRGAVGGGISRPARPVDFELRGCPIDKRQLLEVLTAFLHGRRPNTPSHSVCHECKARGTVCVMVARGTPCLGPVTHAGCGALCPAYGARLLRLLRAEGSKSTGTCAEIGVDVASVSM